MKARALLVAFVLACATAPVQNKTPRVGCPGTLIPPDRIAPDFLMQQEIVAHYGAREVDFQAVLQKRAGTLMVVGLAPYGGKAFVIEQTATAVSFQKFVPKKLPFDPRYMLLDIDRTFFEHPFAQPIANGRRAIDLDGERVTEVWQQGHLQERRFRRLSGSPAGDIVVRYSGWTAGVPFPKHVELHNGWFHYKLSIETLSYRPL